MGGRRPIPTLQAHQKPQFVRVVSPAVAHEVEKMMVAVVDYGTGTSAQIPGVTVAGKTGTAELTDTAAPGQSTPQNTDAWFVGYAPVGHPKVVAGRAVPQPGCRRRGGRAPGARRDRRGAGRRGLRVARGYESAGTAACVAAGDRAPAWRMGELQP